MSQYVSIARPFSHRKPNRARTLMAVSFVRCFRHFAVGDGAAMPTGVNPQAGVWGSSLGGSGLAGVCLHGRWPLLNCS